VRGHRLDCASTSRIAGSVCAGIGGLEQPQAQRAWNPRQPPSTVVSSIFSRALARIGLRRLTAAMMRNRPSSCAQAITGADRLQYCSHPLQYPARKQACRRYTGVEKISNMRSQT